MKVHATEGRIGPRLRPWKAAAFTVAFWGVVGLLFAGNSYLSLWMAGRPAPFATLAIWLQASWQFFSLLTWPVLWLVRRFPLDRQRWTRTVAVFACAGVVVAIVMTIWDVGVILLVGSFTDLAPLAGPYQQASFFQLCEQWFPRNTPLTVIAYAGMVASFHARSYYRRLQERELNSSQLEAQLAQARLAVLKAQLQPHFLFNTLNSISTLMHRDVDAADRMIARLADLLRLSMDSSSAQEVPLRQELDFLQHYLEIEQVRFSDRLRVSLDIEPATLNASVPSLILQPLVENAIRHGISPRRGPGRIAISSRRQGDDLELRVSDDGVGLAANRRGALREGLGLANTRARLDQLYGDRHRLELLEAAESGFEVRLSIPFHSAPPAADSGDVELRT